MPSAIDKIVRSETIKNNVLPYWDKMKNGAGILYRGTYHELKAEEIIVTIFQAGTLSDTPIGTKIIPLREVIDVMFAKADMVIHKDNSKGGPAEDEYDAQA